MAKLSFSIALNLLTQGIKRGANEVEATFKRMRSTIVGTFANLGVGLGVFSFGRQMINAAKDFEAGMARVRAVSNATQAEFKAMEAEAKRLGATTKYTATEAASALENLVRNGLNPGQATEALPRVLQFAQANSIGLAEAADLLTNTLNGFNMAVSESGKTTDIMSSTAAHSATNVLDLGEALKNAAPLANNCKIALQETNAALGTLANVGIKGADAGTGLKQFLIGLSSEAPKGAKALQKYGLEINQATLAADGLAGTLKKLYESGIGQDNQALADVFGRRAFSSAAALINNYEKFIALNNTLNNAEGETARMFEQGTGRMENSLASLASAWEGFQIEFFQGTENWFAAPVDALTNFIRFATGNLSGLITRIGVLWAGAKIVKYFREWQAASGTFYQSMAAQAAAAHSKVNTLETASNTLKRNIKKLETQLEQATADERLAIEVQLNAKKRALAANELAITKAKNAAKVADEKAAAVESLTGWKLTFAQLKLSVATVGASIKAAFATAGPLLFLAVITELIAGVKNLWDNTHKLESLQKEYAAGVAEVTHTAELEELRTIQRELNSANTTVEQQQSLIDKVNKKWGTTYTKVSDVNAALTTQIGLIEKQALAEYNARRLAEMEAKRQEILDRHGGNEQSFLKEYKDKRYSVGDFLHYITPEWLDGTHSMKTEGENFVAYTKEIERLRKNLGDGLKAVADEAGKLGNGDTGGHGGGGGGGHTNTTTQKQTELERLQENYNQSLRELTLKRQAGILSLAEYERALGELVNQTWLSAASGKEKATQESLFAKALGVDAAVMRSNEDYWKMAKAEEDYTKELKALERAKANGVMSEEDYNKALYQLIKATLDDVGKLNVTGGALDELIKTLRLAADKAANIKPETPRDTTFDYKKTATQIAEDELAAAKKRLEELKTAAGGIAGVLENEINAAMAKVTTLEDALKVAKVKQDIKELRKSLAETKWNGIKDIVSGTNSAVNAWKSLGETLSNADATGWEKIMAVWNALTSTVDGIVGIVTTINAWTEASKKLAAAEQAESAIHTATTTQKVAENAAGAASDAASASASVAKATTSVAANTADAASSAAAGAAKLPFPASLLAVGAAIAGVLALMASIPKFAGGGVVSGGTSVNDMQLARVNAGEMILNGSQQKNLWNAIEKGDLGGGQMQIKGYKIKGTDLYILYENVKKKFKKS